MEDATRYPLDTHNVVDPGKPGTDTDEIHVDVVGIEEHTRNVLQRLTHKKSSVRQMPNSLVVKSHYD